MFDGRLRTADVEFVAPRHYPHIREGTLDLAEERVSFPEQIDHQPVARNEELYLGCRRRHEISLHSGCGRYARSTHEDKKQYTGPHVI